MIGSWFEDLTLNYTTSMMVVVTVTAFLADHYGQHDLAVMHWGSHYRLV